MLSLPRLQKAQSRADLARILHYKIVSLNYILYKMPPTEKYSSFEIPKRAGGKRVIQAPEKKVKFLQKRLAELLEECFSEIESSNKKFSKPLFHGFRKRHSIITNATTHQNKRYVLNFDIEDFFPSINFGRVYGFFKKNRAFNLNHQVATAIAQIACFNNQLPQGSPCSPIISNLIGQIMDIYLNNIAKKYKCTYSRYADDITISTNRKFFPVEIATAPESPDSKAWILGNEIQEKLRKAGFKVNNKKTRMSFKDSRQIVTGLCVNKKVNVPKKYYRNVRAMCNSLFGSGSFYVKNLDGSGNENKVNGSLKQLEGMLSYIYNVKTNSRKKSKQSSWRLRNEKVEKEDKNFAIKGLYSKFMFYKHFVSGDKPLVVCEGKTDSIYLRAAIRKFVTTGKTYYGLAEPPKRVSILRSTSINRINRSGVDVRLRIKFFRYTNSTRTILELGGGTGDIKWFIENYGNKIEKFPKSLIKYPVIILIDNDKGCTEIFSLIKKKFAININFQSNEKFYHLFSNLYLVKTPSRGSSSISTTNGLPNKNKKLSKADTGKPSESFVNEHVSCIEDMFSAELLATTLEGKQFSAENDFDKLNFYGKAKFAEQVVLKRFEHIDFSGFSAVLERIAGAIAHYSTHPEANDIGEVNNKLQTNGAPAS